MLLKAKPCSVLKQGIVKKKSDFFETLVTEKTLGSPNANCFGWAANPTLPKNVLSTNTSNEALQSISLFTLAVLRYGNYRQYFT